MRVSVVLAYLCVTGPAWAERAVAVELEPGAPFTSDELTASLLVRLDPSGGPVRVAVRMTPDGLVVDSRGRTRTVDLHGLHGTDAARLVALATADLLYEDLATAPTREPSPPPITATASAPDPFTISALGAASLWSGVMAGGEIDIAVPYGRWIAVVDVGAGQLLGRQLNLTSGSVRVGGGRRERLYDLRAGVTLAPISVSDGGGDETVLVGIGASARLRVPIANEARLVVAAGLDAFATRTDYHVGMSVVSTPWLAPWLALGVEVSP